MYAAPARHRQLTIDDKLTLYVRTRRISGNGSILLTGATRARSHSSIDGDSEKLARRWWTAGDGAADARDGAPTKYTQAHKWWTSGRKATATPAGDSGQESRQVTCYNYIVYKILSCCVLQMYKNYIVIGYETAKVISLLVVNSVSCVSMHTSSKRCV